LAEETLYGRLTPNDFILRLESAPVAYLPLGTLEWHGPHLPLGSDYLQSQGFFIELAKRVGGIVLPPLFLGPDSMKVYKDSEYYGMDVLQKMSGEPIQLIGSAYWVPDTLFTIIIDAVLRQLNRVGFKIVVAHGHGPSTKHLIENREDLEKKHNLRLLSLWRSEHERNSHTEFQYDHAAANETSLMMALHPKLVRMEELPDSLEEEPLGLLGKDPRVHASVEHGKKIISLHLDRMEAILKEQLEKLGKHD
jgi:creatinine amidohydrolase